MVVSCSKTKKVRRVYPDWSNLHYDVLEKIFNGLPLVDKLSFRSVCHSWRALAKSEIKPSLRTPVHKSPLIYLPENRQNMGNGGSIVGVEDGKELMPVEMHHILGSCSGGWLLVMKRETNLLVLWNPIFDIQIHLPSLLNKVPENWITKAVLFGSDPIISSGNYGVVVMYGGGKLAFVKHEDTQWSSFVGEEDYWDVTRYKEGSILALSVKKQLVEIWDFSTTFLPNKTMEIKLPFPQDMPESKEPLRDKYTNQFYIVESEGSVLLVVRCIGNFVDPNGVLRTEDELIEEDEPFLICPFLTKKFYVYKLDSDAKKLVRTENIGNQVLFLGGNQSVSLNAEGFGRCKKNSIYFTDDYWERMDEHDCYGGHDMGIFSLKDGSIEEFYPVDKMSPPFWLLPDVAVVEEPTKAGDSVS